MDGEKDQQWLLPPSVKRGKRALNVWATLCATTFSVLTVMNGTQKNLIDLVLLIVLMAAAIVTTIVVFTTDGVSVKGGGKNRFYRFICTPSFCSSLHIFPSWLFRMGVSS